MIRSVWLRRFVKSTDQRSSSVEKKKPLSYTDEDTFLELLLRGGRG